MTSLIRWAHPVPLEPFRIAKHCVTNREFAAFVLAGGYADESLWSFDGVRWLRQAKLEHPYKWRRVAREDGAGANGVCHGEGEGHGEGDWQTTLSCAQLRHASHGHASHNHASKDPSKDPIKDPSEDPCCRQFRLQWFDSMIPLPPYQPVSHISYYEAEAFCAWAGRRLPTEAEWEAACCGVPTADDGHLAPHKGRPMPWGDGPPTTARANCGMRHATLLDVHELPAGDSIWGVRQMLGNVWEWTSTQFYPYPGYVMDFPYAILGVPLSASDRL
jgi:iron(II)-dependent oxidoreductase